jgi:uncharacterized phage infection (PIP) family protein YhgE
MTVAPPLDLTTEAVASIEDVGSRIEDVFAKVGGDLGRAHTIFADLNAGLSSLAQELAGSKIESASDAFRNIAARLRSLADALPAETALLGTIQAGAAQAAIFLKDLIKHIHMISVIARSSKIEAASLHGDRGDFLSFTQEASDLASSVERSIAACSKDQEQLAEAISMAQRGQREFEKRYHVQLLSVGDELIAARAEIKSRQTQSIQLAELARTSTMRIGGAVGTAIVSLQAGDSTRQRLEHICRGLSIVGAEGGMAPAGGDATGDHAAAAPFVCVLQGAQLKDTVSEFASDIGAIGRSLTALSADSAKLVDHGRVLYGGKDDDMTSFLAVMKRRLAKASTLIAACGHAKASVDASMSVLENMLGKFRGAISALDEAVVDITLIGMNAGLKAGHLGVKGRAFVVIANELQATADRISGGAKMLRPVLDNIEQSANGLKHLRREEDALQVSDLENSIIHALRDIEAGNGQLDQMMGNLTRESALFETLVTGANNVMRGLGGKFATLSSVASRLEAPDTSIRILSTSEARQVGELFDDLYLQYTMVRERDVHLKLSDRFQFIRKPTTGASEKCNTGTEDAIFF